MLCNLIGGAVYFSRSFRDIGNYLETRVDRTLLKSNITRWHGLKISEKERENSSSYRIRIIKTGPLLSPCTIIPLCTPGEDLPPRTVNRNNISIYEIKISYFKIFRVLFDQYWLRLRTLQTLMYSRTTVLIHINALCKALRLPLSRSRA